MEKGIKINSESETMNGSNGLALAILAYEKKVGMKLPNQCKLKILNYKDGENTLGLGFIHNLFIKKVNDKYEIFKDKKELKMSIVKYADQIESDEETEKTIAFWLQEVEYLEYKMKEVENSNV